MLVRGVIAGCLAMFGLMSFAPADVTSSLRLIQVGVLQYAPYAGTEKSYPIAINDAGQVLGGSYSGGWSEGMLWTPSVPRGDTGTLQSDTAFFGPHPKTSSYMPSGLGENGEVAGRLGLFTPNTPNGTTGSVNTAWSSSVPPNRFGVGAEDDGVNVYRVTAAGRTLVYSHAENNTNGVAVNNFGVIAGYAGPNLDSMYVWTPDTPNGTTGSAVTFSMRFGRGAWTNLLINDVGEVVSSRQYEFFGSSVTDAYLYRPGVGVQSLDALIGVSDANVADLNDRGQMLASLNDDTAGYLGLFLLTPNASGGYDRFQLDTLPEMRLGPQTLAKNFDFVSLNNFNQLAGTAQWSDDNGATWRARAVVLTVPEPGFLTLIAATEILLAARRSSCVRKPR